MAKRASRLITAAGAATVAGAIALDQVGGFEGLRLAAYRDVVGIWTACYGETKNIKPGMKFTLGECNNMLLGSIVEHEYGMRQCLKDPDGIPIESYIAAVSLTYNIGVGGFCKSTARKRFDVMDVRGACEAFMSWIKGGKPLRVIKGLVNRRAIERAYCLKGVK